MSKRESPSVPTPPPRHNNNNNDSSQNENLDFDNFHSYPFATGIERKVYKRYCDHGDWFYSNAAGNPQSDLRKLSKCQQYHTSKVRVLVDEKESQKIYLAIFPENRWYWLDGFGEVFGGKEQQRDDTCHRDHVPTDYGGYS